MSGKARPSDEISADRKSGDTSVNLEIGVSEENSPEILISPDNLSKKENPYLFLIAKAGIEGRLNDFYYSEKNKLAARSNSDVFEKKEKAAAVRNLRQLEEAYSAWNAAAAASVPKIKSEILPAAMQDNDACVSALPKSIFTQENLKITRIAIGLISIIFFIAALGFLFDILASSLVSAQKNNFSNNSGLENMPNSDSKPSSSHILKKTVLTPLP